MSFINGIKSVFGIKPKKTEPLYKIEQIVFSETVTKIASVISDNDKNVLEEADLVLKDPDKYILERYIDNPPIDFEFAFKNDVQDKQWWLIHDVLTDNDYIHYLDWKDDAGIFLTEFDALKGRDKISAVVAEKDLDGKDELTEIFTYVNSMIEQDNYVLCVYDIDADGYPIFLTKKENLPLLTESAEKVGHRIGRAG